MGRTRNGPNSKFHHSSPMQTTNCESKQLSDKHVTASALSRKDCFLSEFFTSLPDPSSGFSSVKEIP